MSTYTPLVTLAGQAKIAASIAGGAGIAITQLAVGDANGAVIVPLETMTALVHEVDRVSVTGASRDGSDPTKVIVTAVLPVNNGPYTIREVAIFTDDGQMFAVGAYPDTFKPTPAQGVAVEVDIQFIIQVSETANVVIGIDPSNLFGIDKMLRVPFIGIDQHLINSPPGSPALGAIYTIGASPTGAWVGQAQKLAQWNGSLWLIANAPPRTVVGDAASGIYYRRTASGWLSFDPDSSNQGLATLATAAQMTAGAELTKVVTPALAAAQVQSGSWVYAPDTGAANALVLTLTPPIAAYGAGGLQIVSKVAADNTGAVTVNVNGLGAKSIVRVAGGAQLARGDLKAGGFIGLVFDGTNFQLAWSSWNGIIDTPVIKTVGAGGDFPSLIEASQWVGRYRITITGSVTWQFIDALQTYTGSVAISHPDGVRIFIKGKAMVGAVPTSADFQVTGSTPTARANDNTANIAMLRARYGTELRFTGVKGLSINGLLGLLQDLLITGDATAGCDGIQISTGNYTVHNVAVYNFGRFGWNVSQCIVGLTGPMIGLGCGTANVQFNSDAEITYDLGAILAYSGATGGIQCSGSKVVNAGNVATVARGNADIGLTVQGGSYYEAGVNATHANFSNNGNDGVFVGPDSCLNAPGATVSSNAGNGVNMKFGSTAILSNATLTFNNGFSVLGNYACLAQIVGATYDTLSPALNTVGNNNSLITNT